MDLPAGDQVRKSSKLDIYSHVIRALVLRDMRTRFGGSHWGYAVLVMWPVAHIFVMVAIMAFRGMPSPMGNSPLLFTATACVPSLTFQYISREVMKAIVMNRPLVYYPQVKIFDVLLARLIVEVVKGFTGLLVVMLLLAALGVDPVPVDATMAIGGYCAAILLGIGFGAVNVGIVSFFPGWMIGYIAVTISLYLSCGTFYLPHMMPDQIYELLKWSPMVQIVEWVRLAYNPHLGVEVDYFYVMMWGMASLALGLIMERTLVRRMS